MILEDKILIEKIDHLRLLNESAGADIMKRAINGNEYLYIFYEGDYTIEKGYRTILPLVIGTSPAGGHLLVRAWQISGVSDSKKRYSNDKGKQEFGWRLFRLDKMTSILPTGRKMSNKRIPPSFDKDAYNPNDSQMSKIILAAPPFSKDAVAEPETTETQPTTNVFTPQADKFRQFFKAAEPKKEIMKSDVEELYKLNKQYRKKSPKNTIVITNEKGDFVLRDLRDINKYPENSIIGTLDDLYNQHIGLVPSENKPMSNDFFSKMKNNIKT